MNDVAKGTATEWINFLLIIFKEFLISLTNVVIDNMLKSCWREVVFEVGYDFFVFKIYDKDKHLA